MGPQSKEYIYKLQQKLLIYNWHDRLQGLAHRINTCEYYKEIGSIWKDLSWSDATVEHI